MEIFGIVIPTYQRSDKLTSYYLTRALNSIKNQIYQNYKIYLIGDNYENNNEFLLIATSIIDIDKIFYINLPIALERDKYKTNKNILWNCGGVNASNYGIEKALEDNIKYICRLDHDDWWEKDHLLSIHEHIDNNIIIATKSRYINNRILPLYGSNNYYPQACNLVHSATCIKFSEIPLRYRDVYEAEKKIYPSDADLWVRLSKYMKVNNKNGYLVNKITCNHIEEGK